MGQDLYGSVPIIKEWLDRAAAVADFNLLQLMFHDREKNLQKTRWQQPAMFAMEHAMARYLMALGLRPAAMAGHSLGELTALCLAGVFSAEDGFGIVNQRAICMDKAATMHGDPGIMAAVDAPLALLEELIREREQVHIGNINSPQQIAISGHTEAVKEFCKTLKGMGYRATLLPVSMAFHSPIMQVIHAELEAFIAGIPLHAPQVPVISNTTMAPYPADPVEIRRILMAHLESPVHWMNNVQSLWYDHGVRLFVEVGPGDVLSNLIADTLPEPVCLQTCLPAAESLTYQAALAQLFVQGQLPVAGERRFVSLSGFKKAPPSAPAVPNEPAIPAFAETPEHQAHLAALIEIIMDATGFNRDEIEPDMDLRRDLSIRSSRLPIIMDAAERQFGITIELEDFIQVRTVRDIAQKISELVAQQAGPGLAPATEAVHPGAAIPNGPASPAFVETSEQQEQLEALIQIIMDATGFNRDEIEPDMDLRRDLSIRSSRLPIIMDAAERQFDITIELEDFIQVRTVREIAQKISELVAKKTGSSLPPATRAAEPGPGQDATPQPEPDEASLKRLVFKNVPLGPSASAPIQLSPGDTVLLLSPDRDEGIARSSANILRLDHGVDTLPMPFMQEEIGSNAEGYDLLTDEGSARAAEKIASLASLAGMVITLPKNGSGRLREMADAAQLLKGLFLPLQAFLRSPAKKFVLLFHSREETGTLGQVLAEGLLGLFLSAAQEYPSVQFRTVGLEQDTDLRAALRSALDRGCTPVETSYRAGLTCTLEGRLAPAVFGDSPSLALNPGDVVVMSGGATGISAHLARSLAPFRPRLVFLGRTALDSGIDRAAEIAGILAELRSAGIEASYHACDVTDPAAVRAVLGEVISRYGRIDGIVHGAGVLRDGLIDQMTPDDFARVTEVKFLGAWNLFSAAQGAGLRFFVGLSSAAAIQGNPGQVNYAAANRMMSALLKSLRRENPAIRFKALMLPPIEGAGMAENPELRELLQRKGVGYIHADELAGLFCRELFVAPADDVWVLFMRKLPTLRTVRLDESSRPSQGGEFAGGTLSLSPEQFPMIDRVVSMDLRRDELEASRTFSPEQDLWIADHRPFKFIRHPLASAAMLVETFMEAARLLYPQLQVRGVRQVRLMEMILCPPGVPRPSVISCHRAGNGLREVVCDVSLATRELSPAGRLTDRYTPHCQGQVILAGGEGTIGEELPGFPVRLDELQTPPMNPEKVLAWYQDRSGLEGRYRVLESLDGAGPGVVRGRTSYHETSDFAQLRNARYQYSPYLFEALLQLVAFHLAATNSAERRSMIPMEIGEMRFSRQCREGESITIEARLREQDASGLVWDARGIDDQGTTLMQIQGLKMHWVAA